MSEIGKGTSAGKKLAEYINVIEHTRERKKQIGDEEKAAFAEAKADGFDASTMRTILKLRTLAREDRLKKEELLHVYLHAMGMDDSRPLFAAVGMMGIDIAMRDQVIAALEQFVPASGDIIVRVPGGAPVKLWRSETGAVLIADLEADEAEGLRKKKRKDDLDTYDRDTGEDKSYASPGGSRTPTKSLVDRIADRAEAASAAKREKETKAAAAAASAGVSSHA